MKFIFIILIVLSLAQASKASDGHCISYYRNSGSVVKGYPAEMGTLTSKTKHTMMEIDEYVLANLGAQALSKIKNNESFYVLEGDGHTYFKDFLANGWTVNQRLEKDSGFHEILEIQRGEEKRNVVLRVNGNDRLTHILSLFKLAGLPKENIFSKAGRRDWSREYRETFARVGHKPDLVIYGLSYQAVEALLNIPNRKVLLKTGDMLRGVPSDINSPDINGRPLLVIELESGYKIWVLPVLYGDLTFDVLNAAMGHGAKNILFLGSAGAINPSLQVGDWIQPDSNAISAVSSVGKHVHSPTVHLQTEKWYKGVLKNGDDFVEMELQSAQLAAGKNPSVKLSAGLVITDLVGPREKNFYMIRTGEVPGISEKVQEIVKEIIPQLVHDPIRNFKKFPFVSE